MPLADGDASFNDVEMGASSDLGIWWDRLRGLTDLPRLASEAQPPERLHDPAVPAWADMGWRTIVAEGLHVDGATELANLRGAMSDRRTLTPLYFHDEALSTSDLMVMVLADRCEYDLDATTYSQRHYTPSLQWLAYDPTIYSSTETDVAFGPATTNDFTATNAGVFATPSGRQWRLTLTASGAVTSPYIRIGSSVGNWYSSITWRGLNLTNGQTLTLDNYRGSWIGSLGVDGFVRSDDSEFPDWPSLEPGANAVRVGAVSGSVSGHFYYRSSW